MAFGGNIRALLDTYANCISLLKAFGRSRHDDGTVDTQHEHSRLRKTLKSDRSLVKRAYSSKVSESGSRLKKGDARAIAAVDRVLTKLRSAIASLLRLPSKKDGPDLDYGSLMSLSNASRHDAIKTIDSLARRLGSPSRSSVASLSTAKTSTKPSSSRHKSKSSSIPGAPTSAPGKSRKEARDDPQPRQKSRTAAKESNSAGWGHKAGGERINKSSPLVSRRPPKLSNSQHEARPSRATSASPENLKTPRMAGAVGAARPNRISILSFSSDSTKLGEIPQRRWQSAMPYATTEPDGEEYNVRPTFPLKPYTSTVEVRERRFFGWFGRKREA